MKGNSFSTELGNLGLWCPLFVGIMGRTRKEAAACSPLCLPWPLQERPAQPGGTDCLLLQAEAPATATGPGCDVTWML